MDENRLPPLRPHAYDRLSTMEVETQAGGAGSTIGSEFRQFCDDIYHQTEAAYQDIDWDRISTSAFATLVIILLMFMFAPYMQGDVIVDQESDHLFALDSLTVSEFVAESDRVTGRCEARLNVSNLGDKSVYHEISVVSIFLEHELLWVERTNDFVLDVGSSIMFNVSINKTTVSVPASFVPTLFKESRELHKPLHFKLKYDGMLREGLAAWYEERAHLYIVCGWVEMQFVDETTLKGGPANCSVEN